MQKTLAQCRVPAHATKAHVGSKGIAPLILILGPTWNSLDYGIN